MWLMGIRPDGTLGNVSEQRRLMGMDNRYPSLAEARQAGRAGNSQLTEAAADLKKIMKTAPPRKPIEEENTEVDDEGFDAARTFQAPVDRRAAEDNQVLAFLRTGKGLKKLI